MIPENAMTKPHTGTIDTALFPAPENGRDTALLYRALADETRRNIILLLLQHNLCVSALAGRLNISESAVSQHLKILRQAGLLRGEKRGYFMHYDIDREKLRTLGREIIGMADMTRHVPEHENSCNEKNEHRCSDETRRFCHGRAGKITLPLAPVPGKRS